MQDESPGTPIRYLSTVRCAISVQPDTLSQYSPICYLSTARYAISVQPDMLSQYRPILYLSTANRLAPP
eukprot:791508-Rhodomonas_salina.1